MEQYRVIKRITAAADEEINGSPEKDEIIEKIKTDKKLLFEYNVQKFISLSLRYNYVKHPVPYKLNRKLNKILQSYTGEAK